MAKSRVKKALKKSKLSSASTTEKPKTKMHSWRLCPPGQHYRSASDVDTYVKKNGVAVRAHPRTWTCADNPSGKDQMYREEIHEIAEKYFGRATKPLKFMEGFEATGNDYDHLIQGWTKYWNDVFNPKDPLDPNLVKALMASESSFNPKPKDGRAGKNNLARGLLQVTDQTLKILGDERGELKDHYLTITQDKIYDPNVNICAGIRWLFQKRKPASHQLGREATWDEAVANYKSVLGKSDERSLELLKRFKKYHHGLINNPDEKK